MNSPLREPSTEQLDALASILIRKADGLETLGRALRPVLGNDAGLFADASRARAKATAPGRYWKAEVAKRKLFGPARTGLPDLPPHQPGPGGAYGPMILEASADPETAAECCELAWQASLILAEAATDLEQWFTAHLGYDPRLDLKARLERYEALELCRWTSSFRLAAAPITEASREDSAADTATQVLAPSRSEHPHGPTDFSCK